MFYNIYLMFCRDGEVYCYTMPTSPCSRYGIEANRQIFLDANVTDNTTSRNILYIIQYTVRDNVVVTSAVFYFCLDVGITSVNRRQCSVAPRHPTLTFRFDVRERCLRDVIQ